MGSGRIITFYSYKGGTGRSMVLANVAWILASNAKKVLVLDWDLEAPGLHRYFAPFLADRDLTASDGLIDFVLKFATAAAAPVSQQNGTPSDEPWYLPYANVLRYATSLRWAFEKPGTERSGTIDFIPAGRQGPSYSTRVNSFNWQLFYERLGGGTLLELAKERMRAEYDYILIDSRTGVSDTSGICTVQMPDTLVVCFTLNNQSLEGAAAVAASVYEQRAKAEREIQIFPVPMRLENAEKHKLRARRNLARERFGFFPNSLPSSEHDRYWGDVPVQYEPYYAYEEILPTFGDNPADRVSILASCEQITSYLTGGEVSRLVPAPEPERLRVLREFEGTTAAGAQQEQERLAESVFARFSLEAQAVVRRLMLRLVRIPQEDEIGGERLVQVPVEECGGGIDAVIPPLVGAGLLVKGVDSRGRETLRLAEASLLETWPRLRSWIDEDRSFLLWRQQMQDAVRRWEAGGRDPAWLLSKGARTEAAHWAAVRKDDLSPLETAYVEASLLQIPPARQKGSWLRLTRARAAVAAVLALGVLTALYPPRWVLYSRIYSVSQDSWILSRDRSVIISFASGGRSRVWRRGEPWQDAQELAVPFDVLQVSPRGSYIAGELIREGLFVWPSRSRLPAGGKPTLDFSKSASRMGVNYGFSPDERWIYAVPGDVFLWSPRDPEPPPALPLKFIGINGFVITTVKFSPDGNFICIGDAGSGSLYLQRTKGNSVIKPYRTGSSTGFWFSGDGHWLVFAGLGTHSLYLLNLLQFPDLSEPTMILGPELASSVSNVDFTSDGQWMVARQSTGDLFAGKVGEKLQRITRTKAGPPGRNHPLLEIDPIGRWTIGATSDGAVYVWQLGGNTSLPLRPALPANSSNRIMTSASFSPRGDWLAVGRGGVYVWKTGGVPNRIEVARHTAEVSFRWASDDLHLFTFAGSEMYFGEAGKRLERVQVESSPIQEILVSPGGEELIVLGKNTLAFVKRRFLLWNLPVHTFKWPQLAPVPETD